MGEPRKCLFIATKQLMCHCLSWATFKLLSEPCLSGSISVLLLYVCVVFSFHSQDQLEAVLLVKKIYIRWLMLQEISVICIAYDAKITEINENLEALKHTALWKSKLQSGMSPELRNIDV